MITLPHCNSFKLIRANFAQRPRRIVKVQPYVEGNCRMTKRCILKLPHNHFISYPKSLRDDA